MDIVDDEQLSVFGEFSRSQYIQIEIRIYKYAYLFNKGAVLGRSLYIVTCSIPDRRSRRSCG